MTKHSVQVFKMRDKIFIKGDKILILVPFKSEQFLQIYNGDKVELEIEVTEKD